LFYAVPTGKCQTSTSNYVMVVFNILTHHCPCEEKALSLSSWRFLLQTLVRVKYNDIAGTAVRLFSKHQTIQLRKGVEVYLHTFLTS